MVGVPAVDRVDEAFASVLDRVVVGRTDEPEPAGVHRDPRQPRRDESGASLPVPRSRLMCQCPFLGCVHAASLTPT